MTTKALRKKLGQNTAEYILMLVLVAGAALGAFKVFGATILERFSVVVANMQGTGGSTAADFSSKGALGDTAWDINDAESIGKAD